MEEEREEMGSVTSVAVDHALTACSRRRFHETSAAVRQYVTGKIKLLKSNVTKMTLTDSMVWLFENIWT